jgi:hypothetical protein
VYDGGHFSGVIQPWGKPTTWYLAISDLMPFGRDHRPPRKSAKRSRNRSNDEWTHAVVGFNNESNVRSVDDVKTLFPAVKEGACLSFLKVVRDNSKRCKKSFSASGHH